MSSSTSAHAQNTRRVVSAVLLAPPASRNAMCQFGRVTGKREDEPLWSVAGEAVNMADRSNTAELRFRCLASELALFPVPVLTVFLPALRRQRWQSLLGGAAPPKDLTARKIEAMEAQRLERRKALQARKLQRQEENRRNVAAGNPGDVDFIGLVRSWRRQHASEARPLVLPSSSSSPPRICVAVRKRPLMDHERLRCDHDSVTVHHPKVYVHAAKFKVDGITKYLDHSSFQFDYAFDENSDTDDVYRCTALPLLRFACGGGRATIFCYGQTGSGKTHTMQGLQSLLAHDLYGLLETTAAATANKPSAPPMRVSLSFYELYGGYLQDLLNDRHRLKVLEDGKGEINVHGLTEREAPTADDFLQIVAEGNASRTTHVTQANDTSSRSHAICQIVLRRRTGGAPSSRTRSASNNTGNNAIHGKLSLVDLAGSERGNDTSSHNAQRRAESADINTSLLALKECIRALGDDTSKHIPYRGSKLTLILKDCFAASDARTAMIATVSPGASSADHSLNTLRYADRVKDRHRKPNPANTIGPSSTPPRTNHTDTSRRAAPSLRGPAQGSSPVPLVGRLSTSVPPRSTIVPPQRSSSPSAASLRSPLRPTTGGPRSHPRRDPAPPQWAGGDAAEVDSDVDDLLDLDEEEEDDILDSVDAPKYCDLDVDALIVGEDSNSREGPAADNEDAREDLLKQQEDDLLNAHMGNIQENAELLAEEGTLLQNAQRPDATMDDVREYAEALERILDRKEDMILALQERMAAFQAQLQPQRQ